MLYIFYVMFKLTIVLYKLWSMGIMSYCCLPHFTFLKRFIMYLSILLNVSFLIYACCHTLSWWIYYKYLNVTLHKNELPSFAPLLWDKDTKFILCRVLLYFLYMALLENGLPSFTPVAIEKYNTLSPVIRNLHLRTLSEFTINWYYLVNDF